MKRWLVSAGLWIILSLSLFSSSENWFGFTCNLESPCLALLDSKAITSNFGFEVDYIWSNLLISQSLNWVSYWDEEKYDTVSSSLNIGAYIPLDLLYFKISPGCSMSTSLLNPREYSLSLDGNFSIGIEWTWIKVEIYYMLSFVINRPFYENIIFERSNLIGRLGISVKFKEH